MLFLFNFINFYMLKKYRVNKLIKFVPNLTHTPKKKKKKNSFLQSLQENNNYFFYKENLKK